MQLLFFEIGKESSYNEICHVLVVWGAVQQATVQEIAIKIKTETRRSLNSLNTSKD